MWELNTLLLTACIDKAFVVIIMKFSIGKMIKKRNKIRLDSVKFHCVLCVKALLPLEKALLILGWWKALFILIFSFSTCF